MHHLDLHPWQHAHDFSEDRSRAERNTRIVMLLTAVTMVAEIVAGSVYGSMALLADGWHMATHVAAFGITIVAYRYERRHAADPRFSFGTGKVGVPGGYTSAAAGSLRGPAAAPAHARKPWPHRDPARGGISDPRLRHRP